MMAVAGESRVIETINHPFIESGRTGLWFSKVENASSL